jgi:hypothetical protein
MIRCSSSPIYCASPDSSMNSSAATDRPSSASRAANAKSYNYSPRAFDSQAIADRLHITLRTERNHIANILTKLDAHSQLQALVFALR